MLLSWEFRQFLTDLNKVLDIWPFISDKESGFSHKLLSCKPWGSSQRRSWRSLLCSIHDVKNCISLGIVQVRDCIERLTESEESRFLQEFYNASLRSCLKESIQWVRCVAFVTTFLQQCTLQEHMVNSQGLTTMVTSSRGSTGQDMGLGGLGMANSKSGNYNLLSSG